MKQILSLSLLLTLSWAHANCQLAPDEKLMIGCSYECDEASVSRLTEVAQKMNYKLRFINLNVYQGLQVLLNQVDAVYIPGGADIDPEFYLSDVTKDLQDYTRNNLHLVKFTLEGKKRDQFEYSLIKNLLEQKNDFPNRPLLGICRGMQMMTVARGIPLYLDIKAELGINNRINVYDRINLRDDGTLMRRLYGEKVIKGLKFHHQGLRVHYYNEHKNDYPHVVVSSYSHNEKIAESIEYNDMNALGVQFHPEKSNMKTAYPIFKWFLTKACEHKSSQKDLK